MWKPDHLSLVSLRQARYPPSDPYGAPQGYSYGALPVPQAGGYPLYPVVPSAPPAI